MVPAFDPVLSPGVFPDEAALVDQARSDDPETSALDEIAEITGVPVGTVKSRLHHARTAFRPTPPLQRQISPPRMNASNPPAHPRSRSWSLLRRLLATGLVLGTLVGLAIAVENWRGTQALQQLDWDLRAAGLPQRFEDVVPPQVPDDRNLAMAPGLAALLAYRRDTTNTLHHEIEWADPAEFARLSVATATPPETRIKEPTVGDWTHGESIPLAAWQAYYRALAARTNRAESAERSTNGVLRLPRDVAARYGVPPDLSPIGFNHFLRYRTYPVPAAPGSPAEDVLKALQLAGTDVDALQAVLRDRPECRFPLHYSDRPSWGLLLPHLAKVRQLTTFLRLRSCARLAAGDGNGALRDIELAIRLTEGLRSEPLQISQWVREACIQSWLQPVWEGLSANRWSPDELARLDQLLATVDPQAGITHALLGALHLGDYSPMDSAARARLLEFHSQRPWRDEAIASGAEARAEFFIQWAPQGWFDQNRVRTTRRHWQMLSNHLAWAGTPAVRNWLDQPDSPPYIAGPYTFLDYEFNGRLSFRRLVPELIRCTARVHMARAAVALERCRQRRKTYPAALTELVPEFLTSVPVDPIDRASLRYRLLPEGGFVLYSIGLDGRDDEAQVIDDRRDLFDPQVNGTGDWVWPHSGTR